MFSTKILSILASVVIVLFLALISLQIVEISHYKSEPSVWPATAQ